LFVAPTVFLVFDYDSGAGAVSWILVLDVFGLKDNTKDGQLQAWLVLRDQNIIMLD